MYDYQEQCQYDTLLAPVQPIAPAKGQDQVILGKSRDRYNRHMYAVGYNLLGHTRYR